MPIQVIRTSSDDYPPIFSVRVEHGTTSSELSDWVSENARGSFLEVHLDEEHDLSADDVRRAVRPHVSSVAVEVPPTATA
ncbi:hypothetical protein Q9R32_03520 [Actinotalea sp. AC32]|nr:hypothetical protein [Actinotalea sp. AC32]